MSFPGLPPGHPRNLFPSPDTEALGPQRFQCAICITEAKAWEAAHADAISEATALADQQRTPFIENYLPGHLRDEWPHISDAATMTTIPGVGTCLVCAEHVPAVEA